MPRALAPRAACAAPGGPVTTPVSRGMTSLSQLQAVSKCQAQLIELYEAKVSLLGTITSDTAEVLLARPGASIYKAVDPASLDFVNTTGRGKDENKANYVVGLRMAKEATATDWEQARSLPLQKQPHNTKLLWLLEVWANMLHARLCALQNAMVNLDMVTRSCELSSTPNTDVVNPTGNRIDRLKVTSLCL